MCGRYTLAKGEAEIVSRFKVDETFSQTRLSFNIAPSQEVAAIIEDGGRRLLQSFRWGLIPFWAKDLKKTKPMINARAETIFEKPFFRRSIASRRCLIPADGFYEWRQLGKTKRPMHIGLSGRELFAFAGLWDEWVSTDGEVLRTVTIITTQANDLMSSVHARMPVIVRPDLENLWLDGSVAGINALSPVLQPYDESKMEMYAVGEGVNRPANDGPELVEPVSGED